MADGRNRSSLIKALKVAAWQTRQLEQRLFLIAKGIVELPAAPARPDWKSTWGEL